MDKMTHKTCPVCGSSDLKPHVECEDHLVSHQKFAIVVCGQCGMGMTQNVPSAAHIGEFYKSENYISHSDTKKGLINRLYHQVRILMLKRKQKLVERMTVGKRGNLLDIGCGTGYFISHMKEQGWKVQGTEPDPDARRIAASQLGQEIPDSAGLFDLPERSFDVITMWHVLEHVYELDDYLRQISFLIREGGSFIVAVPNYTCYDARRYQENWAAYDVPRHLWHFSPNSITQLVENYGFQLIARKGMPFDPFYISIISEKYRKNSLGLVTGGLTGAVSLGKSLRDIDQSSSIIYVFKAPLRNTQRS